MKQFVGIAMSGVNTIVADHLKVFFRDVPDNPFDEIHGRDCFDNVLFVFVPVVMKSDSIIVSVIRINAGCSDNRTAEISANIFQDFVRITFPWLGIDIKTVFVIPIAGCLDSFERRADFGLHFIQKSGAERIAKELIIKMFFDAPESVVTKTSFRD